MIIHYMFALLLCSWITEAFYCQEKNTDGGVGLEEGIESGESLGHDCAVENKTESKK
jgi:hypothetical protein